MLLNLSNKKKYKYSPKTKCQFYHRENQNTKIHYLKTIKITHKVLKL